MTKIFFHADDFGVTVEQSKRILDCFHDGVLNSVSIIPNSINMEESYKLIDSYVKDNSLRLVIHLNFVEGHCMANPASVPHLVNDEGNFICSYGSMLKYNYSPKHKLVRKEFIAEISAQIDAVVRLTNSKIINVDSHQHYLQIPMIFEAFCQVVKNNGYIINYLRNPVDPLSPILSTPKLFLQVPIVNHIKLMLLKFLAPSKNAYKKLNCNVPTFFGMPFTCQMFLDRVSVLLPKYKKIAAKRGCDLELMFHPGAVTDITELMDASQDDLVDFYGSNNRSLERDCLLQLKS